MKNRSSMNNKGFSLIELIVAVLIMAIVAGGVIVAFGMIFDTEAKGVGRKVVDVMNQARVLALSKDNTTSAVADTYTNIYAKCYTSGNRLLIDICSDKSGSENVLHSQDLGSKSYQLEFYQLGEVEKTLINGDKIKVTSSSGATNVGTVGTDVVKIYFKKETGGVAGVTVNGGTPITNIKSIKVVQAANTSNYVDLTLVDITGRCTLD